MELTDTPSNHGTPLLSPFIVLSIILIEGFVTISIQILTIRQLVPFVGNSVTVTSLIIGIFLLFLAYGYKRGGLQTSHFAQKLNFNFTVSAFILGIGLSYAFIDLFFLGLYHVARPHLLVSLSIYLFLITAPLVYLLGQTVPITMNLIRQTSTIGHVGGKVLHVSTLGSFLGAVLTTLLLINTLGVANTVFLNYLALMGLVFILTWALQSNWVYIILLAVSAVFIFQLNVAYEHLAFVKTNNYANYGIHEATTLDGKKGKILAINRTPASFINEKGEGFTYIERLKSILFQELELKNQEILVLGAGGFTLSENVDPQHTFTYVDIDPDLSSVVEKHFLDKIKGKVISQDARVYMNQLEEQYDVVFSDVYNTPAAIPSHLITQEYFEDIHRAIKPGGIAVFNLIMNPTLKTDYAKRTDNTLRSVFKNCMSIPLSYRSTAVNILYVCSITKNEGDTLIYTDDLNRSEIDLPLPNR